MRSTIARRLLPIILAVFHNSFPIVSNECICWWDCLVPIAVENLSYFSSHSYCRVDLSQMFCKIPTSLFPTPYDFSVVTPRRA